MLFLNHSEYSKYATTKELDLLLAAQFVISWAGEGGEEPRLAWWKTDMISEFGGEDFFKTFLPMTWEWATFETAREAARRCEEEQRRRLHDPEQIVTLFQLNSPVDDLVEEYLSMLKYENYKPLQALPYLRELVRVGWTLDGFVRWLQRFPAVAHTTEPVGRLITGDPPSDLTTLIQNLLVAHLPLGSSYPMPHYRRRR